MIKKAVKLLYDKRVQIDTGTLYPYECTGDHEMGRTDDINKQQEGMTITSKDDKGQSEHHSDNDNDNKKKVKSRRK